MGFRKITSADNSIFKTLKSLKDKKGRRENKLCIVEGTKIIFENLSIVEDVFVREDFQITPNIAGFEPIILSKELFSKITELETSQGILATVAVMDGDIAPIKFLVLDNIQDPGNMGTILRTAKAFGFNSVIAINCVDVYDQKVIRASMGIQFTLGIKNMTHDAFAEYMRGLEHEPILYVADMGGAFNVDIHNPYYGLVLGSEGKGISDEILKLPNTKIVTIPMVKGVESLNVGVAGGIIMHALSGGV